jgi:hypothetical protein
VTVSASCSWSASSDASWLTITSGASGSGNGTVTYGVTADSGAARSAHLTVQGAGGTVQLTVNQDSQSEVPPLSCSQESSLKSTQGVTSTSIHFINASGATRRIYWLDYSGRRQLYNTLGPSADYEQQTYLTHPWLVADTSDRCVAIYQAPTQPGVATLR